MKNTVKQICKELHIEQVGIAPIGPYIDLEKIWRKRVEQGYVTGFEEPDFDKRIDPKLTMENVQSVIVCLFPYYTRDYEGANLSKSSYFLDYHMIVKEKLELLAAVLTDKIPGFEHKAYVDNGPLADRYLAYLAGLGYFGLHSQLINDSYGTYTFIGYILSNYPFEPDKPLDKTCVQCGACIEACPGGAILGGYVLNPLRCCSYITQKKGDLSEDEIAILSKSSLIYGCDICQEVCPHNAGILPTPMKEFRENIKTHLDAAELQSCSNKEFMRQYRTRGFSWRGKGVLIRNFKYIKK